jgi:cell division transport system permease protein
MIALFYKKALQDIMANRLLNSISVITIALSILIVSAFTLFFINASDIMNAWKQGVRIMAYLKPDASAVNLSELKKKILGFYGVQDVRFISKQEALEQLRNQMQRQSSLLENLKHNPLPDAFEVRMIASSHQVEKIEILATQIESLPFVEDVEYGQAWLGRFNNIFNLFRLTGFAVGGLFCMAAVFIVANTIRLVFYSRREEVEIMRLVGATDGFIKAPFYMEGLILGAAGGILGLGTLFITFILISSNVEKDLSLGLFNIRFFSLWTLGGILLGSMFVGWLGCYLSLKQFLKYD